MRPAVEDWYRDTGTVRFLVLRYLPWFAAFNLAWEAAHVRLYTLWSEESTGYIAFSVVHCTLGDVLIGLLALLLALIVSREGGVREWSFRRLALLSTLFGAGYTAFSEWMNITLLRSWTYAESMPRLSLGDFELGVTPLMQWLVIPPLALFSARRTAGLSHQ
jgi:small-conductance mechanosensitive channel